MSSFCQCGSVARKGFVMEDEELTYLINGSIFEVNKILGSGFLEKVYENALAHELRTKGLGVAQQVPITVNFKGIIVGEYVADILVENRIIIELKALDCLKKIHEAQILNYLKATSHRLGFLVNFTYPKAEIRRFIL